MREIDLKEIIEWSSNRSIKSALRERISIRREKVEQILKKRERTFNLFLDEGDENPYIKEKLNEMASELETIKEEILKTEIELEEMASIKDYDVQQVIDQVETISQFDQNDTVEKRILVSSKLKEFIKEIRIASDGNNPQFEESIKADDGAFVSDEKVTV